MLHRSSRLVSSPAVRVHFASLSMACLLLAGCASVGSTPAYVDDAKLKAQDPCQPQTQSSQGTNAKDPCKK
jgi:outer membrane biogenesis lipoprotein LolB